MSEGQTVDQGVVVCVVEAMKMENEIIAPHAGIITDIAVKVGDTVDSGMLILRINPVTG